MGLHEDAFALLSGLEQARPDCRIRPLYCTLADLALQLGKDEQDYDRKALSAPLGLCYPARYEEIGLLERTIERTDADEYRMLLGCLLYNKRHYERAARLWEESIAHPVSRRNLAIALFSHLGDAVRAEALMRALSEEFPDDMQLLYEYVCLMDKMGTDPRQKIEVLRAHNFTRDDLFTELAKAYNQAFAPEKALQVLAEHDFVPCEGGEHAIADQYLFAHLVLGTKALRNGDAVKAKEYFTQGQILPAHLGAGIWNHCKRIPLKYHEAVCLEQLGETKAAKEIYRYIAEVEIEYFSNMHLRELPFWQVLSLRRLGKNVTADRLCARYATLWSTVKDVKDNGFFGTTPFFISFMDDPRKPRLALHQYLNALCGFLKKDAAAAEAMAQSAHTNNENLYALYWHEFGFEE